MNCPRIVALAVTLVLAGQAQPVRSTRNRPPQPGSYAYHGPVEAAITDDFERGVSTTIYRFRSGGREVTAYQSATAAPAIRCGDIVRLEGFRQGDSMAVTHAAVTESLAAEPACTSVGDQRVAVILAAFPGMRPPASTRATLQPLLFDPNSFSANSWYRERSYGRISLSGEVFGPYTLDRAYTCSETAAMQSAAIRAAGRDIDFTQFQRYILIFPGVRDCAFGAMATLGCREINSADGTFHASWIWSNDFTNQAQLLDLLIHELGHNLGLGHSRMLRFPGESLAIDDYRGVPVEYGDVTAAMGRGRYGDFAAAHKLHMGWLEPETDVVTVDEDGEFFLAPLAAESGLRALRVRRRLGVNEWLWLEHRRLSEGNPALANGGTHHGFNGILVRRETPESGTLTHLLDMTPASLDESRFDMGVPSEANPELPPGATWSDPHSDLTITAGDLTDAGIAVTIRYAERCAVPAQHQITVGEGDQTVALPVTVAAPECEWQTASARSWLTAARDLSGDASIHFDAAPDLFHRSGLVSIGRHAVRVTQKGPPRDMQILSVSPPGTGLPVNSPVPFVLYARDENGVEDMQVLELSVLPGPASTALPCYFRYSTLRRIVEVSTDGLEYHDAESPPVGNSGACSLEGSTWRPNQTDLLFRFSLTYTGAEGETLAISLRAQDADGVMGPWIPATSMTTVGYCRALPTADYFLYLSSGGANQSLNIAASAPSCEWTAASEVNWIRLAFNSAAGNGGLRFDVEANPDPVTREGRVLVNGTPVRFVQFGKAEIQPYYVTLRPPETVVSHFNGIGGLTFFYGLGDLLPAESQSPWIQIVRVERSADRREVIFLFEENPDPAPRLGSILIGGKPYTVLQQAAPLPESAP